MITFALAILGSQTGSPSRTELLDWGRQTLASIRRDFTLPNSKLFAEDNSRSHPAFNWGVGVMLSALNAAAREDAQYRPWLAESATAAHSYWHSAPPVAGFSVLPGQTDPDRYYDDNAWMVMSLVETYEVLGDRKYLNWAEDGLRFVSSGEDEKLGGGIYWKERERASKNTCSNGPSVAAAMAVYRHRPRPVLLESAKRVYRWTIKNLRDPKDGLYWDNINLSGKVEQTKWTYNSALMIRSACELYRVTGESEFRTDAITLAMATQNRWGNLGSAGIQDDGKFAHLLTEAWIRVKTELLADGSTFSRKLDADTMDAMKFLHERVRDSAGHYGVRWERAAADPLKSFSLIDQASAARAYFQAAKLLGPHVQR